MSDRAQLLARLKAAAPKARAKKPCGSCGKKRADFERPAECFGICDERDYGDKIIFCLHAREWVNWSLCESCVNNGGLRRREIVEAHARRKLCGKLTGRVALKMYYHGDEEDPFDAWDIQCSAYPGETFPEFRCWGCRYFVTGDGANEVSAYHQRAQRGAGPSLDG